MNQVFRMLVPKGALIEPREPVRGPSDVHVASEAVVLARGLNEALKPAHALSMYRRALELEPGNGEAARELALTLFDAGSADEAVLALEQFVEAHSTDHETRLTLASLYLRRGELDSAERELGRCLVDQPKWSAPFVPLIRLLWRRGRFAEAKAQLEAYRTLSPDPRSVEMLVSMMSSSR